MAIKNDGTVLTWCHDIWDEGDVEDWQDIVDVCKDDDSQTIGLKSNGTVVITGGRYGGGTKTEDKLNIAKWNNIISIETGGGIYGLRADGTVVALPETEYASGVDGTLVKRTITGPDVSGWNNIKAISSSEGNIVHSVDGYVLSNTRHVAGLKYDGTVVDTSYQDVNKWTNITAIETGREHTVGLKSDGTVVAVGANKYGECNVSNWYGIKAIYTGPTWTIGLKNDGTVVATGKNNHNQCNISDWTDIVDIDTFDFFGDDNMATTVGLKSDGTLVITDTERYNSDDFRKERSNIKLP